MTILRLRSLREFPILSLQVTDSKAASRHGISAADVPALVYYEHEIPHVYAGDPEEPLAVLQGTLAYDVNKSFSIFNPLLSEIDRCAVRTLRGEVCNNL